MNYVCPLSGFSEHVFNIRKGEDVYGDLYCGRHCSSSGSSSDLQHGAGPEEGKICAVWCRLQPVQRTLSLEKYDFDLTYK